jgi:hypothetical protein
MCFLRLRLHLYSLYPVIWNRNKLLNISTIRLHNYVNSDFFIANKHQLSNIPYWSEYETWIDNFLGNLEFWRYVVRPSCIRVNAVNYSMFPYVGEWRVSRKCINWRHFVGIYVKFTAAFLCAYFWTEILSTMFVVFCQWDKIRIT